MKKSIVRNHSVFCFESRLRNELNDCKLKNDKYKSIAQLLKRHSKDEILSLVCSETKAYSEILSSFESANESQEDNDLFVFAFFVDDNCLIKVGQFNRINVYYYQDRYRIDGEAIFPWDYPHKISCLGISSNADCRAIEDFLALNTVDYFLKYTPNILSSRNQFVRDEASGIYKVNESFSIVIDSHIVFHIARGNGHMEKRYIADTWWYDDEEILTDLLNMPISSFGNKYKAYWC